MQKEKKWLKPFFDFDDDQPTKKPKKSVVLKKSVSHIEKIASASVLPNINHKNWMKNFDPVNVEDLAVNNKKIQEVEEWIKVVNSNSTCSDMLLLTGPVGCGKTTTVHTIASKYKMKVTEWITPVDIDIPTDYGDYEYKEKQSTKFLDFILKAANFSSLLDSNNSKLVLVEDFPNTFIRTPSEFTDILNQYKNRAKSPIVFICSESHSDGKNTAASLFTPSLKEQFQIHHITFNGVTATGLRAALKRVADIINKKHSAVYNIPTSDVIECVVNSSTGDVRSAVLNLHFACLKGSSQNLETSLIEEKETKSKTTKTTRKKKQASSRFLSLGKDQTVSILHGVGRVLNPKVTENGNFTHPPTEIIEQFVSQPTSFVNFLEENYLVHFSCSVDADRAASALSDADYLLGEWREKMCQEYGLYVAVSGLMLANKAPLSAWNPVRGPKNMKINYPTPREIPLLEENYLYKGKTLVSDYQTYCKIIGSKPRPKQTNGIEIEF
ncbi:cell cycle checkpoint protein RAD17 [Pectinophora gossypiella]|uniref:cell cycle checkpoint protein RAD17 n=1 Tax=Pectinophora gossypiella TaxID=13191 RepID=UPI00214EF35C|nr:cell cycle checkpoint protein RAD17 [Pectinophora gossypiella]